MAIRSGERKGKNKEIMKLAQESSCAVFVFSSVMKGILFVPAGPGLGSGV
jgi:hypothetical protein